MFLYRRHSNHAPPEYTPTPYEEYLHDTIEPYETHILFAERLSYVLCSLVILAMLIHGCRVWRQAYPHAGLALGKVPGAAVATAACRAVGYYCIRTGPWVWPAGHYMVICAAFTIGTVCWCFSLHPYYRPHWYVGSPPLTLRSGMMALAMIPFLYATPMKLNPVAIITGLSHAHLQLYHKWMGVLVLFFSLVHGAAFFWQIGAQSGMKGLRYNWKEYSFLLWTGVVATFILLWMVFSSIRPIRNMSYEFFVLQHIVCVFLFLGFMFAHVDTNLSSHLWLWATVGIWIFSVAGRGLLVLFSSNFFSGSRAQVQVQIEAGQSPGTALGATAQYLRLTFETPLRWRAGQHVYVRMPGVAPLQAHPFTCLSLPDANPHMPNRLVLIARVHRGITQAIYDKVICHGQSIKDGSTLATLSTNEDLTTVLNQLEKGTGLDSEELNGDSLTSTHTMSMTALLDGPYGYTYSLGMYENVLLVCAGAGVTFALPQLTTLLQRSVRGDAIITKRVRFVWSVQTFEIVRMVKQELMEMNEILASVPFSVDFEIHATQVKGPVPQAAWTSYAQTSYGARLALHEIVENEVKKAMDMKSSAMAVTVCATKDGVEAVSNAVAKANGNLVLGKLGSLHDVRLIAESFSF